jgi:hypothetical protein
VTNQGPEVAEAASDESLLHSAKIPRWLSRLDCKPCFVPLLEFRKGRTETVVAPSHVDSGTWRYGDVPSPYSARSAPYDVALPPYVGGASAWRPLTCIFPSFPLQRRDVARAVQLLRAIRQLNYAGWRSEFAELSLLCTLWEAQAEKAHELMVPAYSMKSTAPQLQPLSATAAKSPPETFVVVTA